MNIQIFALKKCYDSQKTERYFKERKVKYQYIDLHKYGLSKGEFESIRTSVDLKDLINNEAKEYKSLNMQQLGTGSVAAEVLFKNPKLYKSPIVRNSKQATVGYQPEIWKGWE
jgi:arsenate reductase (glutaredoxin)